MEGDEVAIVALVEVDLVVVDVAAIVDFDSPVLAKTVLVWPDAAAHFVPEDEEVFDGCI